MCLVAMSGLGPTLSVAKAQTTPDPYINALDDRPAARLRRAREQGKMAARALPPQTMRPIIDHVPPADGPDMVVIPPGRFMMGSPVSQSKRDRNEGPQVPVTIDYAFEIGRYEVTFAEWSECVKAGGCNGFRPEDNGWGRGKRPVTNISYNDAQSYIKWLNAKTGRNYRLPSEAEWEYVARAGEQLPFSTGSGRAISAQFANFNGEFPYGPGSTPGKYLRKTVPVGSYAANSFGVHDIHGNVYEFVSDCYVAGHKGNPGNGAPRRDGNCDARIIRGGSWVTHGYQMRAAKRLRYTKDHRYDDFGFRLARTIPTPPRPPMQPGAGPVVRTNPVAPLQPIRR
ncbi:hypothetical protein GCM10007854_20480 [Algimonas porphyrae]|uniref:Sulfatase-modifying factor enzyme-like domain-containing protein n=1 Tax=Algimonas porphyrae TaxID=1128113 RepID=A0ABQ5V0K5_9PROT|nr:hypothetical protein GCM10007854_20480 [Algimonas porphyrae]